MLYTFMKLKEKKNLRGARILKNYFILQGYIPWQQSLW